MQKLKQVFLGSVLVLSLLAVSLPARAAALTTNQVNAILMLLQSFGADQGVISSVQATLTGTTNTGSTTPATTPTWNQGGMPPGQIGKAMCIALNRNLTIGSKGDDVRELQDMLREDDELGFTASSTGTFGPLTARAMARFQMKNGIASSTTGAVGPLTRGFFERACGKGLDGERGNTEQRGAGQLQSMNDRRAFVGTVASVSNNTFTIQLRETNTTSPSITVTSTTIIKVAVASSTPRVGTMSDITVGAQVGAEVTKATDGTLAAVTVGIGALPPPMPMRE